MPDTLDIELSVKGMRQALRDYKALAQAIDDTGAAQDRLNRSISRTSRSGGAAIPIGSSLATTGGSSAPVRSRSSYVQGPNQRLPRLLAQHAQAQAEGNIAAQRDTELAISRVQRQLGRAQPRTFGQKLNTLVRSTRFGKDGVQPLIGRALDLFGGGGKAGGALEGLAGGGMEAGAMEAGAAGGPVGLVLAGLAIVGGKAVEALEKMTERAAEASVQFQNLRYSTGGTGYETGQLSALGRAGGLDAQGMAGLSGNLQERISSDPMAMAAGLRLGIFNTPRPFGKTDEAGQLMQAITGLRGMAPDQQIRTMRQLGVNIPAQMLQMSSAQFGMVNQDARSDSKIFNPRFAQQSADFQASLGRVQSAIEALEAALAPAVIDGFTAFFNGLADGIRSVADFIEQHQSSILKIEDFFESLGDLMAGNVADATKHIANITGGKDDKLAGEISKNTAATQANTQAMGAPGTYGVINRPDSIPPGMMTGVNLQRASEERGLRLSGF